MSWDGSRAHRRGDGTHIAETARSGSGHLARLVAGTSTALVVAVVAVAGCGQRDVDALKPRHAVRETLPSSPSSATTAHRSRVIEDLNPDGVAAHTRQNADGVDLNRNFPYDWQPIGRGGDDQYSGPRALSEPEARAAAAFLDRVRPSITVWFHQHAGLVDYSGGNPAIERWFARAIRLPVAQLRRFPGSVAGWENHRYRDSTAFVVELPSGRPSLALVRRATATIDRIGTGLMRRRVERTSVNAA